MHISFDMLCIPQVYTYSFLLTYMLCAILRYVYTRHLINVYSFILTSCVFLRNMYIRLLWYSWCMLPATPEEFHGSSTCDDKSANVHTSLLTFFSVAQPRKDFTAVAVVTANLLLANNVETISFIAGFGGAVVSGVIIFVVLPSSTCARCRCVLRFIASAAAATKGIVAAAAAAEIGSGGGGGSDHSLPCNNTRQ